MLKVLGRNNSSNVQKVMWCIGELGLAYTREDYGGAFGKTKEPAYLALNPNALVPTIDDDGFILWESNAIVRYLAAKHGMGTLCPSDLRARADADRWMDWQVTTTGPQMFVIFWTLVRTPEDKRDMKAVADARAKMIDLWAIVDRVLVNRPFLAGDRLTMGDIPLGIAAYRWYSLIKDAPAMPGVDAWWKRLSERPAFREHVSGVPLT
jgi:glutathione S-transferase